MKKDPDALILTRQELNIMKVVWERGIATVKEVRQSMLHERAIAHTTVLTLMRVLEKKGALDHTKRGREFLYQPLLSRRQAIRSQVRDILIRYFDGKPERLVIFVLQNEANTSDKLAAIHELLESKIRHRQIRESANAASD